MQVESYFTRRLPVLIAYTYEGGHNGSQRRESGATPRPNGDKVLCSSCMTFRTITSGTAQEA